MAGSEVGVGQHQPLRSSLPSIVIGADDVVHRRVPGSQDGRSSFRRTTTDFGLFPGLDKSNALIDVVRAR